jgi:uncharacterized protein YacL
MLLLLRLIGMAVAGVAGWQLGLTLAGFSSTSAGPASDAMRYVLVLALAGAALGLLLTPYATIVPLRRLWRLTRSVAVPDLLGATLGLVVGLLIAALASFPISLLPDPFGRWLPAAVAVLLAWLGMAAGSLRKDEIFGTLSTVWSPPTRNGRSEASAGGGLRGALLLDTSAVIDGRIVEVCLSGFVGGPLLVPRFVLDELQLLADSADPQRRQRGRRGLAMLERLQQGADLEPIDQDFADLRGVDSKLVRLSRLRQAAIVTTDYNLTRVAGLQGVPVLNVNDLANALRAVVAPGEDVSIDIVQEGRERGQGVGYLEDGTMVIVEGGRRLIGSRVDVEVTRILPTAGGRLAFGRLRQPGTTDPEAEAPRHPSRGSLRVVRDTVPHDGE